MTNPTDLRALARELRERHTALTSGYRHAEFAREYPGIMALLRLIPETAAALEAAAEALEQHLDTKLGFLRCRVCQATWRRYRDGVLALIRGPASDCCACADDLNAALDPIAIEAAMSASEEKRG